MSTYISVNELKIGIDFGKNVIPVGRLATRDYKTYFEYDTDFIKTGLEISPIKLPLGPGLQVFDYQTFEGLPGVFNDSLPDGWGRLLFDRYIRSQHLLPDDFSSLDRLAHVGTTGLGALVYEPDHSMTDKEKDTIDLDILSRHTQEILDGTADEVLEELLNLNGSSAGARPKALIGLDTTKTHIISGKHNLGPDHEHWLVKFANSSDGADAGAIEYVYALMAKEAGVEMMPVHLFDAAKGSGYFATQRFDREGDKRFHMHTASGLLHSNFRMPSLDYEDLIALTGVLTKDVREIEKMFRLAVFNVLSQNRDDHGKNFSFLMGENGDWKLSPAYDLTFSSGPRGQQSTMVMGEGQSPSVGHLLKLGEEAGLKESKVNEIVAQTKYALGHWEVLADKHGVAKTNIKFIQSRIGTV